MYKWSCMNDGCSHIYFKVSYSCSYSHALLLQVEQLHKIFKLCGSPPDEYWKRTKLPHATLFKPQQPYDSCLRETFKDLPKTTTSLLETLLSVEPYKRGTASSALASEVVMQCNVIICLMLIIWYDGWKDCLDLFGMHGSEVTLLNPLILHHMVIKSIVIAMSFWVVHVFFFSYQVFNHSCICPTFMVQCQTNAACLATFHNCLEHCFI